MATFAFAPSNFLAPTFRLNGYKSINTKPKQFYNPYNNSVIFQTSKISCNINPTKESNTHNDTLLKQDSNQSNDSTIDFTNILYLSLISATLLADIQPAEAVPESLVQTFKSIPASLAHPALMWILFGTCGYTFYLGYQSSLIRKSDADKRKELIKSKVTDRHFRTSSFLFSIMTIATFTGMANTYTRTGKLFPGPHLYAGLGLVALMSVMSALVPYMQKGKDWARNTHFSLAFVAISLFGWQAKSGMAIVAKLLKWD